MPDIRTSALGGVPFGTSDNRPTSPSIGQTYYNGTLGVQEIYTNSGWLPATGANDFNVTLTGPVTTATFTKEYFAGAYTIASALLDSSYDIYVYSNDGSLSGYTKSPSLNATGNFNKIVVVGGSTGDLLSFSYKTTFSATSTNSETTAAPFLTSVSPTNLTENNDLATITGGNFATDVVLKILDSSGNEISPKSYTRVTSSQITFTRSDNLLSGTYGLKVSNPNVTDPTGSNLNKLLSSFNTGVGPVWQTATSLPEVAKNIAYSTTLIATDADNDTVTYSLVSGTLPSGLSLNSTTGVISGTYTGSDFTNSSIVIRALDGGGNSLNRTFTMFSSNPVWVTSSIDTYILPSSAYSFQLSATDNSTLTYSLPSGSLPSGITISSSGLISGTTTTEGYSSTLTFRATDAAGNYSERNLALITGGYTTLSFTPYYAGGGGSLSDVVLTNNNTSSVNVFRQTGSDIWNVGAYTQEFKPPLTIEFNKAGPSTDNQQSYTMVGGLPTEMLSNMIADNGGSYHYGYNWYPVATNDPANIYERQWSSGTLTTTTGGTWSSGNLFRISFFPDGRVKYYNVSQSSTPRKEVDHSDFTFIRGQVNLYSRNATTGGVSNFRIYLGRVWNGSAFVTP